MSALIKPPMPGMGILQPRTIQELDVFSQRAATSGMVPPQYVNKPGAIFIAVQFGSELGLSPMQSLINIATVNNRPTVYADAMVALCRQSPACEDIKEWFEGEDDSLTAWCEAKRRGVSPVRQSFSVADAKRAGLWGKQGPWTQYPKRMLTWRARSWALRDQFADVLRGLIAFEEAVDIPRDNFAGTTIDGNAHSVQLSSDVRTEPTEPTELSKGDLRDQINAELPLTSPPPKRTARAWLDELRLRVSACTSRDEFDAIVGGADVEKAVKHFRNGAAQELNEIMADGMAHWVETEHADAPFPGDA